MSYADLLRPRKEVLNEAGVEGIIDLANLDDPKKRKLESRPGDFFSLTWPTADTRRVIDVLHRRFSGDRDAPGLFLFEGLKGSGKSHLLLLVYHLFASGAQAKGWLDKNQLKCALPGEAVVVINKHTDLPLYSIWDFVFQNLTGNPPPRSVVQPSRAEVEAALGDRTLVLILDELEQGIRVISDDAIRAQNIAFLQMLSEWSNREPRVTVFASIYSDQAEPGSTLKRVPACRIRFEHAADKARVVLHRLFENYLEFDSKKVRPTVESYLSAWRRHEAVRGEGVEARMTESFPFSPDVMGIVLERIPSRGGFQNVRGALAFLSALVRLTYKSADLITPAHADLSDQAISVMLSDLEPSGDLIRRAQANLKELSESALVSDLGSAAMLYTLSGRGRERGATREELLRAVCGPSTNINDFEQGLGVLQRYAANFHFQEARYFFDLEENADAKVELRSLGVDDDLARELLGKLWRDDLFHAPEASVVLLRLDLAKEALEGLEKGRLRFVLGRRRLKPEERRELYYGLSERNQVVLLEPRDSAFDALGHADLLKWAKRVKATESLKGPDLDPERNAEYERIGREDRKNILDALRRAGMFFVRVERRDARGDEEIFEEESVGNAVTKEDVIAKLSQEIYPPQLISEHLAERLEDYQGRTVKEVDRDYRCILGFPMPTHAASVTKAIRLLCQQGKVGIRHPRGDFSGREPELTESELMAASLDAPFDRPHPPQPPVGPRPPAPPPPGGGSEPPLFPPDTGPRGESRQIVVPPQSSIGALRMELARQLQALGSAEVDRARFTVFLEADTGDLSTLPATVRGSLSGPGALTAEISVRRDQVGRKGDLEQLVERLPVIAGATYSARIDMTILESSDRDSQRS